MLWPENTFVDFDTGLNVVINKLRHVLDDSAATPRFIETLPRRGYRFICPVAVSQPTSQTGAAPSTGERRRSKWSVPGMAVSAVLILSVAAAVLWSRQAAGRAGATEATSEGVRSAGRRPVNPAAYDAYLRGRYQLAARAETEHNGRLPSLLSNLAVVDGAAGHVQDAFRLMDELTEISRHQYVSPSLFAVPYIQLRDFNRGFEWLERAYRERSNVLLYLCCLPHFDPFRGDPRFDRLVEKVRQPHKPRE